MVRYKSGDKIVCIFMPRNYGHRLPVGKIFVVHRVNDHDGEQWVQFEGIPAEYEAKYFKPVGEAERPFLFKVSIANGHTYRIRCSNEAIKELADIIGDDHLEEITALPTRLKKKVS